MPKMHLALLGRIFGQNMWRPLHLWKNVHRESRATKEMWGGGRGRTSPPSGGIPQPERVLLQNPGWGRGLPRASRSPRQTDGWRGRMAVRLRGDLEATGHDPQRAARNHPPPKNTLTDCSMKRKKTNCCMGGHTNKQTVGQVKAFAGKNYNSEMFCRKMLRNVLEYHPTVMAAWS